MSPLSRLLDPATVQRLNQLTIAARRAVEGSAVGTHRSPLKGASVEFRQHRSYVPGDEIRRLDWRVLGRTDRPYVREYDEETNLRSVLMLDCSGSMAYGGKNAVKFQAGIRLVAALAYLLLGQSESVGLACIGHGLEGWIAPHGGSAQLSRLVDQLERVAPDGPSEFVKAVQQTADQLERRAMVIIVSDLLHPADEVRRAIARLRHDRHEVVLARVLHQDEVEFPFRRWWRFLGLEGESPALLETAAVRDRYLENFRKHEAELLADCSRLGCDLVRLDSAADSYDMVVSLIRRAG
jgi:uncharacterized protein (DUF58 family)